MKVCMWYRVWMIGGYALIMYPLWTHSTCHPVFNVHVILFPLPTHHTLIIPTLSSTVLSILNLLFFLFLFLFFFLFICCCFSNCFPPLQVLLHNALGAVAPVVSFRRFLWQWPALFLWKKKQRLVLPPCTSNWLASRPQTPPPPPLNVIMTLGKMICESPLIHVAIRILVIINKVVLFVCGV